MLPQDPSPPCHRMLVITARVRKPPEKYFHSMKGKKYAIAVMQVAALLETCKNAMALAQMSVKLMPKGEHQKADLVGMVMA